MTAPLRATPLAAFRDGDKRSRLAPPGPTRAGAPTNQRGAKEAALEDIAEQAAERGANAIIGVDLDYESVGDSMLMVSVNGTAVRLE